MEVCGSVTETRLKLRQDNRPTVVVPTMGALHEGHLSLVKIARDWRQGGGQVAVSIFVNPAQFAPHEDFGSYPRQMESDLAKCEQLGVDLVFAPDQAVMYRGDASARITEDVLSKGLCGASRPHFFGGVCTVVAKLFNITQPAAAVFGQKDFQQLTIIRRMVRDLDFPVEILAGPIIREPDGLAMSSRNAYLTSEQRARATAIYHGLQQARSAILDGQRDAAALGALVRDHITRRHGRVDYVEVVDPEQLTPLRQIRHRVLIAAAAYWGSTRLIDNLHLTGLEL